MKVWLAILFACVLGFPAWANQTAAPTQDEQVERRLAAIASELRCLVCQNESIAGSRADLAVDLRRQIHEQIQAGRSDDQIMTYMVERYGDFVRYLPPLKATTLVLWFGPAILATSGLVALSLYLRRRSRRMDDLPLNDDERVRAEALLRQDPDNKQ
jgi:cytochrome c-type biogenesis protein CcmH